MWLAGAPGVLERKTLESQAAFDEAPPILPRVRKALGIEDLAAVNAIGTPRPCLRRLDTVTLDEAFDAPAFG